MTIVSTIAPMLAGGNTVVALASETNPLPAMVLAEVCATSDVPGGVVNILTGLRDELVPEIANHRDIDAVGGAFDLPRGGTYRLMIHNDTPYTVVVLDRAASRGSRGSR